MAPANGQPARKKQRFSETGTLPRKPGLGGPGLSQTPAGDPEAQRKKQEETEAAQRRKEEDDEEVQKQEALAKIKDLEKWITALENEKEQFGKATDLVDEVRDGLESATARISVEGLDTAVVLDIGKDSAVLEIVDPFEED